MPSAPQDIVHQETDLFSHMWNLPHNEDESTNILIIGPMGKGKSTAGAYIAWKLQRDSKGKHKFDYSKDVYYSFEGFIKAIVKAKKGRVLIFDEAGTQEGVYNRNWFSETNKGASELMQTVRSKNLVLIYITPAKKFIDIQIRKAFNVHINMVRKDRNRKVSFGIVKKVSWNPETDDEYGEYFTRRSDAGIVKSITMWAFPAPPKTVMRAIKAGEKKNKSRLTDNIVKRILADKAESERDSSNTLDYDKLYEKAKGMMDLITKPDRNGDPKVNANLIRVRLKVGAPAAKLVKDMLENAAYSGDLDISA